MEAKNLHVFTTRSNPLRWEAPDALYRNFADHMIASGVTLHVIECAYGDRPFVCEVPGVDHIGVRAESRIWVKENLLNIGVRRNPQAQYIAWVDADVTFRNPHWATDTLHALQLWPVVQPWDTALDLGPKDEIIAVHKSFAKVLHDGGPVVPANKKWWQGDGGPYSYPHSGYAMALTRQAYGDLGGFLDIGGMGSGDHHMALGLVGQAHISMPDGTTENYRRHVMRWQERALRHVNGRIGYVPNTIEHGYHGPKRARGYISRWDMFTKHQFTPDEDLKVNADGVYELAGNKPDLQRDFDRYLMSRNEDSNAM